MKNNNKNILSTIPKIIRHSKYKITDLAYFGGTPLFSRVRSTGQLFAPNQKLFFHRMRQVFKDRWITNNGPFVLELEERLRCLHGTSACIAMANASFAIILLLKALAKKQSGNIILPAFSFRGLPHLVRWAGFEPNFCDVNPVTHTLDINDVQRKINSETAAILAVNNVNALCDAEVLKGVADVNGIPFIVDSVYAVWSDKSLSPSSRYSDAEVYSLHATKLINGFEGGYVTTSNKDLALYLKENRNYGIQKGGHVAAVGMNAKLNEIHAAMAITSLESLDKIVDGNRKRIFMYRSFFEGVPGVSFAEYDNASYCELILLEVTDIWPFSRDETIDLLRAENAMARPYYDPPLHMSRDKKPSLVLPETEFLSSRFIQMPAGEHMVENDIKKLADFFNYLHDNSGDIRKIFGEFKR